MRHLVLIAGLALVGCKQEPTTLGGPVGTVPAKAATVEFGGIGAAVGSDANGFLLSGIYEGAPAARAGLKVGDRLIQIDGKPLAGLPMDQVLGAIRGEVGTKLALSVTTGVESVRVVELVREKRERSAR